MTASAVEVLGISKVFNRCPVIDRLSFSVPPAGRALIVGPSGAGKSTLLRIIAGLDLPDGGEIRLHGEPAGDSRWALEPHRRNMGFVFQNPTLWPHMTVRENILFGLERLPRSAARQRADALLAAAGIGHLPDRYPDQISGGEAKRAALVRSLAPLPRILLVDEPLANLDEKTRENTLEFLLTVVTENNMTLVYVTHDAAEAKTVGGCVIQLTSPSISPL